MKKDRLRDDSDEIRNLGDLIKAREPDTSHFAKDTDAFDVDLELPEDLDVDSALTFPHPHRKQDEPEMLGALDEDNMDEAYGDPELLPGDYSHGYSEATTTDPRDDKDEIVEDEIKSIEHLSFEQIEDERPTETLSDDFDPEELDEEP